MAEEGELRKIPLTVVRKNRTCGRSCCLSFSFWMLIWGDFRELSLQGMMLSPLLKGFGVGEEGVLAGVVAS